VPARWRRWRITRTPPEIAARIATAIRIGTSGEEPPPLSAGDAFGAAAAGAGEPAGDAGLALPAWAPVWPPWPTPPPVPPATAGAPPPPPEDDPEPAEPPEDPDSGSLGAVEEVPPPLGDFEVFADDSCCLDELQLGAQASGSDSPYCVPAESFA
jgi:hypothetical protein